MCDRIAIVNHGEVVACDDTSALLGRLDAKTLLLRLAAAREAVPALGEDVTATLREPGLLALTYSRSQVSAPDLLARAARAAAARRARSCSTTATSPGASWTPASGSGAASPRTTSAATRCAST